MAHGTLFLLPTPLGAEGQEALPNYLLERVRQLAFFIVEHPKVARRWIKQCDHPRPLAELEWLELNEHTATNDLSPFLAPLRAGHDVGLMTEAGCPGIADPGAEVVREAHRQGITVRPLVGPSAILLALMGSGLNGQKFLFQGYLSAKKADLAQQIQRLEQQSLREKLTQICIEAPYRNLQLLSALVAALRPATLLTVASELTTPEEYIRTQRVEQWRREPQQPNLHKHPTVFLFLAQ